MLVKLYLNEKFRYIEKRFVKKPTLFWMNFFFHMFLSKRLS